MSIIEGTTMHHRCRIKESRFNGANLLKHNVHVVNTDIGMFRPTWMFMDCIRKQTHQCAQHKLKIVYKTLQLKHLGKHLKKIKINFLGSHAVVRVKTFPIMYQFTKRYSKVLDNYTFASQWFILQPIYSKNIYHLLKLSRVLRAIFTKYYIKVIMYIKVKQFVWNCIILFYELKLPAFTFY